MEGVEHLALSELLEWLVRVGPSWLARRWLHVTPERLAASVSVALQPRNPISVTCPAGVPTLAVYLSIHNYGPLDLLLDRMVVDVWAGQPVAYGVMADRHLVRRHGPTQEVIQFHAILTTEAYKQWERNKEQVNATLTVHVRAYFESKVGAFIVHGQLEQDLK